VALVILDRDGVINQDSDQYIRCLADWNPIPGSIGAIAELSRAGYRIAIATNQSGLGRGYFSREDMEEIHTRLCQMVEEQGGRIDGIFYCPHLPEEGCHCRKPATGLVEAIAAELGESPTGAWFIGDSLKDLQVAQRCHCRPALVRSGKGEHTLAQLQSPNVDLSNPLDIPVYPDLACAARAILHT
jgi:D-glycero-D-manno-heptose 1,7-bisphosphate phosphatase